MRSDLRCCCHYRDLHVEAHFVCLKCWHVVPYELLKSHRCSHQTARGVRRAPPLSFPGAKSSWQVASEPWLGAAFGAVARAYGASIARDDRRSGPLVPVSCERCTMIRPSPSFTFTLLPGDAARAPFDRTSLRAQSADPGKMAAASARLFADSGRGREAP
jgi:hypothetical protein